MEKVLLLCVAVGLMASHPVAADTFKDVPKDHWAAESVRMVSDTGIMKGYPDGTFRGDRPVTRYELAVALQSLVEAIEQSQKPLATGSSDIKLSPKKHWAKKSVDFLKTGSFLPKNSPILTSGNKPITHVELADAMASVSARLIELRVPPPSAKE
ncbi:MAG: S-layer homology domain-containing protein [Chloroflexi bacterium]|nr:S-layer homology domain-containing protein [Chloroflexota bacterium]MCL5103371.1 S-layer homology domain-containing protein [Armatimonadota bacterium]